MYCTRKDITSMNSNIIVVSNLLITPLSESDRYTIETLYNYLVIAGISLYQVKKQKNIKR